ncbi:MAG: hypothetical protein LBH01_08110 [Verrucomicrobiales bacterium]|jgi:hypothetical protein|nr:hypothetical protein [Verrucomicrobiales bacterium]
MKKLPRWFWLSLVHPVFSLLAFGTVWLIFALTAPGDQQWFRLASAILKYVFLANLPGHYLLYQAYEAQVQTIWITYAICVAIVLLTWLVTVLPLCWCAGNCFRWLRR